MRCEAQLCLVPRLPPPSSGCSLSEICILGILVTGDGGLASHQQLLCSPAAARPLACVMNAVLGTTVAGEKARWRNGNAGKDCCIALLRPCVESIHIQL